jgi:hypothetical protein
MAIGFQNLEDHDKSAKRQHTAPNGPRLGCSEIRSKRLVQWATVRNGKPNPKQMPSLFRFLKILEGGSSVQSRPVIQKKKIASFEGESSL